MNNVKSLLSSVEKVFTATQDAFDKMKDGDRITAVNLAAQISSSLSLSSKDTLELVVFFVHHSDDVYISRGKNGGIIKGVKPVKVAKTPPPTTNG